MTRNKEDNENKLVFLSDYSEKDKIWDKHKRDAVELADLLSGDPEFEKYEKRLRETAKDIGFRWVDDLDTGESKLKLDTAWFSRWRHDPVSNWRKTMKWRSLWFNALPNIFAAYSTHRWVLLTLTVQNCRVEDLNETCRHLNKSFRKLTRGAKLAKYLDPRRESSKDKNGQPIAGYYKALEVTKESDVFDKKGNLIRKGREGYAHPHIHVLLHLPASYFSHGYITQKEWSELWQNAAGLDYEPVIDVRTVTSKKGVEDKFQGLFDAVMEVTKYPNKAADLLVNAEWTKEYIRQMDRVRLIDVGGSLRTFIKEERFDDDLIHIDENNDQDETVIEVEVAKLRFTFNELKTVRRYVKNNLDNKANLFIFDG